MLRGEFERPFFLRVLEADVPDEHHQARYRRPTRAISDGGRNQAGDDDAAEPEIDDERSAEAGTPVGERREDHRAVARDEVAGNVQADRHRRDAVERAPACSSVYSIGLAHDLREQP
jgi:hypothetical protein